jgi:hypothetical protein
LLSFFSWLGQTVPGFPARQQRETSVHSYRHRRTGRLIGTGLAAAALTTTAWLPGAAAASTGWQVAFRAHSGASTNFTGLTGVSASGKASAWAVGGTDLSGGATGAPAAERWNGKAWHAATLPSGLTGTLGAVSTPAQNDAWAVSRLTGYALHWNGTAWSVAKRWPEPAHGLNRELTGVTAFSPTNVWVFGAPGASPGFGTWHLRGTTWHKVTGPGGEIFTASAISPTDMWAIGADNVAPDDILVRYNGTTWQQVTSPALTGLQFDSILALSDSNVWAAATVGGSLPEHLLHFDGKAWTSQPAPSGVQLRSIAPDGHGGLWFSAFRPKGSQLPLAEHRSATGTWSGHTLPTGTGQAFGIALIPGTSSLWASGYLETNGATGSDAVIWGDGPAA